MPELLAQRFSMIHSSSPQPSYLDMVEVTGSTPVGPTKIGRGLEWKMEKTFRERIEGAIVSLFDTAIEQAKKKEQWQGIETLRLAASSMELSFRQRLAVAMDSLLHYGTEQAKEGNWEGIRILQDSIAFIDERPPDIFGEDGIPAGFIKFELGPKPNSDEGST